VSIRKNLERPHPQVVRGRGYDHAFVLRTSGEGFPSCPRCGGGILSRGECSK
jgi:hypothetical protein